MAKNIITALIFAVMLAAIAFPAVAQSGAFVRSEDIVNQTIKSWDIAHEGVGKSEIRPEAVSWSELTDSVDDIIAFERCPDPIKDDDFTFEPTHLFMDSAGVLHLESTGDTDQAVLMVCADITPAE